MKIDRNKKDIQNLLAEFKNSIALSVKRQEDQQQTVKSASESFHNHDPNSGFDRNMNDKVDVYVSSISKQYEHDMNNLYREIGMLRSELEIIYDKNRRAFIYDEISQFPQNMDADDKKIAIANLE